MSKHKGSALVLAWPETTARGDEKWYTYLKKLGIVQNLNFRVGHAAIVLIDHLSGKLHYYDFGRYIAPRGMGRARSAATDPKLILETKPDIENHSNDLLNLHEIVLELEAKKAYTHGLGPMYFSIANDLHFPDSFREAEYWVHKGSTPYGAVAKDNNNCSRFVWQVLQSGYSKSGIKAVRAFHETIYPSPITNVANSNPGREVFIFNDGLLEKTRFSRMRTLRYFVGQVVHNINPKLAKKLPKDHFLGFMSEPQRPANIPPIAQWLGGIGEGAWYVVSKMNPGILLVSRYLPDGQMDYCQEFHCEDIFHEVLEEHIKVDYDSHFLFTHIQIGGQKVKLEKVKTTEKSLIINH